jgi:hypothetical protein
MTTTAMHSPDTYIHYAIRWMEKYGNLPLAEQVEGVKLELAASPTQVASTLLGFALQEWARLANEELAQEAEGYHRILAREQGKGSGWDSCVSTLLDMAAQEFRNRNDIEAQRLRKIADQLSCHEARQKLTADEQAAWATFSDLHEKLHPEGNSVDG